MCQLSPRVDFAFKKLFGSEENKDILMSFINAIVSEKDQVTDIHLKNPYNEKQFPKDKLSILDIKAKDSEGKWYNIEIQIRSRMYYEKRALYYWSKLYTSQLEESRDYQLLTKTISIHVLNFNCFEKEPNYHNVFRLMNVRSKETYFEDLELHFIELDKFNDDLSHIKTVLDRWTLFLKRSDLYEKDKMPEVFSEEPSIKKAINVLDTMWLNENERELYEAYLKRLRDEDAVLKKVELDAREEGREEGEAIGVRKTVINMHKSNLPIETICQVTGYSVEKVNEIIRTHSL